MMPILFSFETATGLPEFVGYLFIFFLGAIIGSFLNVVIHRVPLEQSIVFPNSACPKALINMIQIGKKKAKEIYQKVVGRTGIEPVTR